MPRLSKQAQEKKLADARLNREIEKLYAANCSGIQIALTDIPKVFAAALKAHAAGLDMREAIVSLVQTIRKN